MSYLPPAAFTLEEAHHSGVVHIHGIQEENENEGGEFVNVELQSPALAAVPAPEPMASTNGDIKHQPLDHALQTSSQSHLADFDTPKKSDIHSMEIDSNPSKPANGEETSNKSLRNATWLSCFFLITTDILGPTSAPWAMAQLGYVPGTLIYLGLGGIALYTGILLWRMYLRLDNENHRILNYSDLVQRIFGARARHATNILQSIQLLFNVAVIIIGNAQGLSQVSNGKVCFVVLALIWTIAGMLIGQIRALHNLRGLSNVAIWLNFLVIFITLGVVCNSLPNFAAASAQNAVAIGPITASAFVYDTLWTTKLVGVMQCVYAYGGAMIFIEIMAEMKDPREFIKSLLSAEAIIIIAYLIFGLVVYSKQGQFTINPANQGISVYEWQTVTNVFNLVGALIAAGLYGNIGLKVIYQCIVKDVFKGPELDSKNGRYLWTVLVLGYWALAFIIASAIPQISNISGLVAAICILQFSYTFPFFMQLGLDYQSMAERVWWKKITFMNCLHLTLGLASLALAGLGAYSAVEGIIAAAATPQGSSFTCASPV